MVMTETQMLCTELMDDILFETLGIHFLEAQVSFDVKTKIKPAIAKAKKKDEEGAAALGFMKKVEKKADDESSTKKATAMAGLSAAEKRKLDMEVKPKINLALKL